MAFYFASDVHAGLVLNGVPTDSGERFMAWLDRIAPDAEAVFLLGDIFDFWFEYKRTIPPGYDRLLDKLKELTSRGIEIHFFPGNHDMWPRDYLSRECGLVVHREGYETTLCGKRVYLLHGHGLDAKDWGEKLMLSIFRSRNAYRFATTFVPPRRMYRFGNRWSQSRKLKHVGSPAFRKEEEGVVAFARRYLNKHAVDIFVFGHLHVPTEYRLTETSTLYVLGEWLTDREPVYGKLDASGFTLERFKA